MARREAPDKPEFFQQQALVRLTDPHTRSVRIRPQEGDSKRLKPGHQAFGIDCGQPPGSPRFSAPDGVDAQSGLLRQRLDRQAGRGPGRCKLFRGGQKITMWANIDHNEAPC